MPLHFSSFTASALGACFVLVAGPALAATITVTTTEDELNQDGDCSLREAVKAFNTGSPVDACQAGTGNDTITFAKKLAGKTITLTETGPGEDDNETGDLDIKFNNFDGPDSLIIGPPDGGSASIVINGNMNSGNCSSADRVLDISAVEVGPDGVDLTLRNLTITHGCVQNTEIKALGGGVRINAPVASLRLINVAIVDNKAISELSRAAGGGLYANLNSDATAHLVIKNTRIAGNAARGGSSNDFNGAAGGGAYLNGAVGKLTVVNSVFENNTVRANDDIAGGGLYVETSFQASLQNVTIENSRFSNNVLNTGDQPSAGAEGGGAWLSLSSSGQVFPITITASQFNNNTVDATGRIHGGGLYLSAFGVSRVTIRSTSASGNEVSGAALGLAGAGAYLNLDAGESFSFALEITASQFNDNFAANANGTVRGGGLFLLAHDIGSATIASSTFLKNTLQSAGVVRGGGLAVFASGCETACVFVENSTISGNLINGGTGAGVFFGQSSGPLPLTVAVNNTTIVNNSIGTTANPTGQGGGLFAGPATTVRLSNTVIAGNKAANGPDCAAAIITPNSSNGNVISEGYNLIGNSAGCGLSNQTGDQFGTSDNPIDPLLGPLVVGGQETSTRFHVPQPGSPLIDAGNPATPNGMAPACEPTDQRGVQRPHDGDGNGSFVCDIGSVERKANEAPVLYREFPDLALAFNETRTLNLLDFFKDPEGGSLRFRATSSNPAVVSVNLSDSKLTLTANSFGTATITVTAADPLNALRVATISGEARRTSGFASTGGRIGGGCVLGGAGRRAVDPVLLLLLLMVGAWRVAARTAHRRSTMSRNRKP